ncbi:MAG TPA: L,D-transpeptidase family protein, partial [Nitrospirota bacterium]|nr:L,D-transpeptidase family protein [Nitrospirota bacterium]
IKLSTTTAIFLLALVQMLSLRVLAGEGQESLPTDKLRDQIKNLQQEAVKLEEQNQGLRQMIKELEDNEIYLVVDTENSRLMMRKGSKTILSTIVGTGSHEFVEEENGRNWYFETPLGSFTVLGKERNPAWIRPDWSYVEENMPIPPLNDPDRIVRGVLGKYALLLGNGYKIHGTKYTNLLGTHFTHGCISLGDDDLALIHSTVKVGTKVYIY